jgi:protein O-mannosyl-transferase
MTFSSRNTLVFGIVLVGFFTFALYFKVKGFDMLQYDDPKHVFENPRILKPTLDNIFFFWQKPFFSLFVPVTYTVWGLVSNFAGPTPTPEPFHQLNLFLHVLNVILVFRVLLAILTRRTKLDWDGTDFHTVFAAAIGSLVFAWHPIQVESVAWISCAKDLLCTAFGLSMLCLWRSRDQTEKSDRHLWQGLALVAYVASLLSKPSGVMIPFWIVVIDVMAFSRQWKESARELAVWFAVIVPLLIMTKSEQPTEKIESLGPLWSRPLVALDAIGFYLRKTVFPYHLGVDYTRTPKAALSSGWILVHAAWVTGMMLGAYRWRKRFPALFFALCLIVIPLVPVLGFVPFSFQTSSTVSDRYFYLGLFGVALLVATAVSRLRDLTWRAMLAVPLMGLFALSSLQLENWRNSERLFTHTLTYYPQSLVSWTNLGFDYHVRGFFEKAAHSFGQAIALSPNNADLIVNLGAAQTASGDAKSGMQTLTSALQLNPKNTNAHFNLGILHLRSQNLTKSIEHLRIANQLAPNVPQIQRALHSAESALAKK